MAGTVGVLRSTFARSRRRVAQGTARAEAEAERLARRTRALDQETEELEEAARAVAKRRREVFTAVLNAEKRAAARRRRGPQGEGGVDAPARGAERGVGLGDEIIARLDAHVCA